MNKLGYTFYIGIAGAILSCVSICLDFFGVVDIMPIITEIFVCISAILIAIGVVKTDDKKDIEQIKKDLEEKMPDDDEK